MKNSLPDKTKPVAVGNNNSSEWLKQKLFQQKKTSQIKPIQYRGTQHRG